MLAPDFGDPEFMADMHGIIELGAPICTNQQLKSWVYAGVKQWEGPSKGGGGGPWYPNRYSQQFPSRFRHF